MSTIVREMPGGWSRATLVLQEGRTVHVCGPNPDDARSEVEKYLGLVPPTMRALASYRFSTQPRRSFR